MIISRAYSTVDLEAFHVEAVANGWLVTLGANNGRDGYRHGERFAFSTPGELAEWISRTLPQHGGALEKQ